MGFLVVACTALSILVLHQQRTIRGLDMELHLITDMVGQTALPTGERVIPLATFGTTPASDEQSPGVLDFGRDRAATLVFVHNGTCGACEELIPRLFSLKDDLDGASVRFVGIQLDAKTAAELKNPQAMAGLENRGVAMNQGTWLKRIPLTPSLLLIDPQGIVRGTWYGSPNDLQWADLRQRIGDARRGWN